jgi:hypothetical protein
MIWPEERFLTALDLRQPVVFVECALQSSVGFPPIREFKRNQVVSRFVQPEIKNAVFCPSSEPTLHRSLLPLFHRHRRLPAVLSPFRKPLHQLTLRPLPLSYGAFDRLTEGSHVEPAVDGGSTNAF